MKTQRPATPPATAHSDAHGHDHGQDHGHEHRDHSHCAHNPARADGNGVKLTPGRQAILDVLCEAGQPLGAYDMMDKLVDEQGKRPAPITVYRALDFLLEHGLVHKLESRNTFMACAHSHGTREPVIFLICEKCGSVVEATSDALHADLDKIASQNKFKPRTQVVELAGLCASCA